MAKYPEKQAEFRAALRRAVLTKSNLMNQQLMRGTRFVYSEQYPTQVLNTKLGRFIRINATDVNGYTIDNLLRVMMATDKYVTLPERTVVDAETGLEVILPEETMDYVQVVEDAVDKVAKVDYINLVTNVNSSEDDDDYYEDDEDDTILTYDDFNNITGLRDVVIEPQVIHFQGKLEDVDAEFDPANLEIEDGTISSDTTSMDMTEMCETIAAAGADKDGSGKPPSKKMPPNTVLVEQALNDLAQVEAISKFHKRTSVLTKADLLALEPKVKQLLKAFQGVGGTVKVSTPTKRMSSKDMACDRDKCYIRKTDTKGKHIKLNLLIDMSGSMSGEPVKNAVKLVYLFNQLAKQGYVTMSVMYSTTSTNFKLTLPASDAEILALCQTQSAEGLAKTIQAHAATIKGTNTICITDGDIVDEPIDKMFWSKHKSISTGVYVNPSVTNYSEYSGKLNKWFNHSIVRKTLDELIEWLIRVGLKG